MQLISRRACWQSWIVAACVVTFSPFIASPPAHAADEPAAVKLVIDYGDGVQKEFNKLEWKAGMSVLDALQLASKHPRGIKPAVQGNGEFTMVIAIDDLKNQGNGKNWLYKVNGKMADRSCGVLKLEAGDEVTWLFSDSMP